MDGGELLTKVKRNYSKFPEIFEDFCDYIVYTSGKSAKKVCEEIVSLISD